MTTCGLLLLRAAVPDKRADIGTDVSELPLSGLCTLAEAGCSMPIGPSPLDAIAALRAFANDLRPIVFFGGSAPPPPLLASSLLTTSFTASFWLLLSLALCGTVRSAGVELVREVRRPVMGCVEVVEGRRPAVVVMVVGAAVVEEKAVALALKEGLAAPLGGLRRFCLTAGRERERWVMPGVSLLCSVACSCTVAAGGGTGAGLLLATVSISSDADFVTAAAKVLTADFIASDPSKMLLPLSSSLDRWCQ